MWIPKMNCKYELQSPTWTANVNRQHKSQTYRKHRELTSCTELKPQTAHKNIHLHIQSLSNQLISKLSCIHAELSHAKKMCLQGMCSQKRPRWDCIHAFWSGPLLSAARIIEYYGMYQWKAKTQIILWICDFWHAWKHHFSLDAAQFYILIYYYVSIPV